jgi:Tfp pilus assembly protein PilN
MYIERIRIEEGFLDGLDVALVPGLNVVIGARGTGKTSLIELVRFCLGVSGYTAESGKRSRDHALSVLGAGQIMVTLSDGEQKIVVSRTAADEAPRTSSPFVPPIIFSQTEVESLGLQAGGRLRLLDGFVDDRRNANTQEIGATSEVRSLTAEAEALRREIDELRRQVEQIPAIDRELVELAPAEQGVAKVSTEAAEKKKKLDALSAAMASTSVASASVDRFKQAISRWATSLRGAIETVPRAEPWPEGSGDDLLVSARSRVQRAYTHLRNALEELGLAEAELADLVAISAERRITVEEQARHLRKEIEELQTGAGSIIRRGQQLRERKAQLESLNKLLAERCKSLDALVKRRGTALDRLDSIRDSRYKLRADTASRLNAAVGPRIRVTVTRAGQFEAFSAAIADVLRGSGLRYGDLSTALAEHITPRELLEAADGSDFQLLEDAVGISKDRAARALAHLREADLGALATIPVEDSVAFQLLDGSDYKGYRGAFDWATLYGSIATRASTHRTDVDRRST